MTKKVLLFLLVFGVALSGVFAQETTWINPHDPMNTMLPESMPAAVSNGMVYDEFDVVVRAPAELSKWEGYSIFTGYGNYESWATLPITGTPGPVASPINPFTTGAIGAANLGSYLLGYTFPLLDWRAGFISGFEFTKTGHLSVLSGDSYYKASTNDVVDTAGVSGTADYTATDSSEYTAHTDTTSKTFGVGLDLGFIGVSLFGDIDARKKTWGGTYSYSLAEGESTYDTISPDIVTSKTVRYGLDAEGKPAAFPTTGGGWTIGALGEVPFDFMGISAPATGAIMITNDGISSTPTYAQPKTVTITETNVSGAAAVTDTSTLTYTKEETTIDGSDEIGTADSGEISTELGGTFNHALDTENYKASDWDFGLNAQIDPIIELAEGVRAKTRGKLSYTLGLETDTQAGEYSINYSVANGATTNSLYTETESIIEPKSTTGHNISGEIGGVMEFTDGEVLTIATGAFYNPYFNLSSTARENKVTTKTTSWKDETGTDPEAANTTTPDTIGPGNAQGTRVDTTTVSYDGNDVDNSTTHAFIIPVSAQLNVVPEKLQLIGGYQLTHSATTTFTRDADTTTTTTTTVSDSAGDAIYPDPAAVDDVDQTTTTAEYRSKFSSTWAGQANWMIRWMPYESVTVDLSGQSVMNALNFDLFGDNGAGADFNPNSIISTLEMSVTFHVK